MSQQLYTNVSGYLNGMHLVETSKIKLDRIGNHQINETMAKGMAGITPGASRIKISMESGVPASGFEVNFGSFIRSSAGVPTPVTLTLFAAGKVLTSNGWITDDNFSGGVDEKSMVSCEFVGEWADWVA